MEVKNVWTDGANERINSMFSIQLNNNFCYISGSFDASQCMSNCYILT